jgi:hypothetical protein
VEPAQPAGMSANLVPSRAMSPGRRKPAAVTRYPTTPNMQIRPCLISTNRRRSNLAWSPSATSPSGSKNPSGATAPKSSSKAMFRAVEVLPCWAGAKAAAEAAREARTASFMVMMTGEGEGAESVSAVDNERDETSHVVATKVEPAQIFVPLYLSLS